MDFSKDDTVQKELLIGGVDLDCTRFESLLITYLLEFFLASSLTFSCLFPRVAL